LTVEKSTPGLAEGGSPGLCTRRHEATLDTKDSNGLNDSLRLSASYGSPDGTPGRTRPQLATAEAHCPARESML